MARTKRGPKFYSQVVRAVEHLRDSKGSTLVRIIEHVRSKISRSRKQPAPRNIVVQIRKALEHGLEQGVFLHRAGKYKLVTSRRIIPVDSLEIFDQCRRRRKRRSKGKRFKRGKRSRGRKRNLFETHDSDEESTTERKSKTPKKNTKNNTVEFEENCEEEKEQDKGQPESKVRSRSAGGPNTKSAKLREPKPTRTTYPTYGDVMDGDDNDQLPKSQNRNSNRRRCIKLPAPAHPKPRPETDADSVPLGVNMCPSHPEHLHNTTSQPHVSTTPTPTHRSTLHVNKPSSHTAEVQDEVEDQSFTSTEEEQQSRDAYLN